MFNNVIILYMYMPYKDPEYFKHYHQKNKRHRIQTTQQWRVKKRSKYLKYLKINKEKIRLINKKWREHNKVHLKIYHANYRKINRKILNTKLRQKRYNNINIRLIHNLSSRITYAIKNNTKSAHSMELIGCSIPFLRSHLEKLFASGMTWKNYGIGYEKWNIDHIKPCSLFDLKHPEEQKKCFHYTNLQPLWHLDNIRKGNNYQIL